MYELIQNAEDNSYNSAQAKGLSPSLVFAVAPNKIVIDSNEDGFTEENVRAICKLGGSTKLQAAALLARKALASSPSSKWHPEFGYSLARFALRLNMVRMTMAWEW